MYGNEPSLWDPALNGMDRLRCIVNYLTRMSCFTRMVPWTLLTKVHCATCRGLSPWFASEPGQREGQTVLFGHWASLNGEARAPRCVALDTGCVWGRNLRPIGWMMA